MSAPRAGVTVCDFAALLLGALGHRDGEFTSLLYKDRAEKRHTAVKAPADVFAAISKIPTDANVFFGVNPVSGPVRTNSGRGTEADVTRLAGLWCDLDIKKGACASLDVARAIVANLSTRLGTRPSVIVESGHGLHAYWPITDGAISEKFTTGQARALVKRWGRLVEVEAQNLHARADTVFDLVRMLRVPGTFNNKIRGNGAEPIPAVAYTDTGGPLSVAEIDERLRELGVVQEDGDDTADVKEINPPQHWRFGPDTHGYVAKIIDDIPGDGPETGGGRHQWVLKQAVRLACAYMHGCISETDWRRAQKLLDARLCELRAATGETVPKYEVPAAFGWAVKKAATKTAEAAREDLGGDVHTGQRDEIDEEEFWSAFPELAACRAYARSVRVAPWAMLGAALAIASATTPPHVVLPGIVGDYASVNLYVNLPGKSGAIKSQAIAAARAWLRTTPRPESVKPGSGQGIAKCFAYVKRTKGGEPVQVGKRWTAVAVIPEIDTLTAAGAMTSSSLWAEFRSAWSDERVGHDYTDATKTVVLQPRRYRLAMIVGVQPLRAQPLFDDIDAGTPQRFVWFPTCDPAAPDDRPEQPLPLVLPRWPGDETHNFDIDDFWAGMLDTPADRSALTVLKIPPEATEAVDTVAREKLRGNPDIDPLDGHKLLCQLKVAAALMRLCNRREITSKDWELAAGVMAVSDHIREQVRAELAAEATRRNLNAARVSGARKIVETRMAADAEAEDIKRVANVIVEALAKADGWTLPGAKVSKAVAGRERHMVPKALEYLEIDGRIKVEDIERRGQAGIRVTLLDDGEQTN
jgi:hypothetical protein